MDASTIQRTRQQIEEITSVGEIEAKIEAGPLRMLYDAQFALQTAVEAGTDPEQIVALAKAVGWAEALSYTVHAQAQTFSQFWRQQELTRPGTT